MTGPSLHLVAGLTGVSQNPDLPLLTSGERGRGFTCERQVPKNIG